MSPRHKSDKSKHMRFEIRMTQETADKLEYCAEKLEATKTADEDGHKESTSIRHEHERSL